MPVIVAIKNEIGALLLDDPLQILVVIERPAPGREARDRRVMDENHAIEAALAQVVQDRNQAIELVRSDPAASPEQRLRHGTREADQRDVAALPDEGKEHIRIGGIAR